MRSEEKKRPKHIGFLTALGNVHTGIVGGFLVLNLVGKPIEFHCTAPVRPNRAQEILYGVTLEGFVCGEQIAPALFARSQLELAAVLTNSPFMASAARCSSAPLALVFKRLDTNKETTEEKITVDALDARTNGATEFAVWDRSKDDLKNEHDETTTETDALRSLFYDSLDAAPFVPGVDYSKWKPFTLGKNSLAMPSSFLSEATGKLSFDECVARITPFFRSIDSVEPFERIRLAVEEVRKSY